MKRKAVALVTFLLSSSVFPAEKTFNDIWKDFVEHSHEMESLRKEKEAGDIAALRSRLHWVPKVSLMAQWTDTNDPGQVFFNNIGQRAVSQMDFVPSSLNHPDRQQFINGVVGLDLPLYEGGMKTRQVSMLEGMARSMEMDLKARKTEEYSELSRQYGSLIIHNTNKNSLKSLQSDLRKIISSYQVGSKSNPVGYSGLLGLKGVSNRIEGLLTAYDMQISNDKGFISQRARLDSEWSPETKKLQDYLRETFIENEMQDMSSMLLANQMKVEAMGVTPEMEKARYLPRVGLFAQNTLYSGDRDTANSQSLGLYLQWELFNSESFKKSSEARAKLLAAEARLRSGKEQEGIMKSNLVSSKEALEKNLKLLEDSNELLNEQARNSMRLFGSGLLNALQLAEVINRRVDVIEEKNKAETQYLEIRSRLYQLTH